MAITWIWNDRVRRRNYSVNGQSIYDQAASVDYLSFAINCCYFYFFLFTARDENDSSDERKWDKCFDHDVDEVGNDGLRYANGLLMLS